MTEPAARVSNLRFGFPGAAEPVLRGLDLDLPAGATTAILGPSGAGKSTLLRLLAGLLPPDDGEIVLPGAQDGVSVAMVFQDPRLLPWMTVRQNLEFALEAAGVPSGQHADRWRPLLDAVDLSQAADLRPSALSGGMAQRVGVVRALALWPRLLLLDEPFGAVDPLLRDQLQAVLVKLLGARHTTAVLVTHDVREAAVLADHIVVLGGRPARVVSRRNIHLPHPRDGLGDAVAEVARSIRADLVTAAGLQSVRGASP